MASKAYGYAFDAILESVVSANHPTFQQTKLISPVEAKPGWSDSIATQCMCSPIATSLHFQ